MNSCGKVTGTELARIFGVSRRWIYTLRQKGLPMEGKLFDVATCVQWQLDQVTEKAAGEPDDILEARKRLLIAQTKKCNMEVANLRGTLVRRDEAEGLLMKIASIVASQLDAIGPRLAAQVSAMTDQKEIQVLLFDEYRNVRESIAQAIMELPEPGGGRDPSAAEADGGGMGGYEESSTA